MLRGNSSLLRGTRVSKAKAAAAMGVSDVGLLAAEVS
jgi:hypothetical protein